MMNEGKRRGGCLTKSLIVAGVIAVVVVVGFIVVSILLPITPYYAF